MTPYTSEMFARSRDPQTIQIHREIIGGDTIKSNGYTSLLAVIIGTIPEVARKNRMV